MDIRSRPSGIERRHLNLVFRRWFAEVVVLARIDKRIVTLNGGLQYFTPHRFGLVFVADCGSELRQSVRTKKISIGVDIRRRYLPALALYRLAIEDRPDRTGRIVRRLGIVVHRDDGIEQTVLVWMVFDPLTIAII